MEFESVYLGVPIVLSNRKHLTYINAKVEKCRIWRENGFYYIDDGGQFIFELTQGNVRQALLKRPPGPKPEYSPISKEREDLFIKTAREQVAREQVASKTKSSKNS
jgi:hypothetical protein